MNAPDYLVVLWTFADKETMPATVAAHTKKSRNFVSGAPRWMDGERIEYIRRDPAVILAAALELPEVRKAIAGAIFDPGATEGYKCDRTLTQWQVDAVMRALAALTTKGDAK
jgi:hypothetical protein